MNVDKSGVKIHNKKIVICPNLFLDELVIKNRIRRKDKMLNELLKEGKIKHDIKIVMT